MSDADVQGARKGIVSALVTVGVIGLALFVYDLVATDEPTGAEESKAGGELTDEIFDSEIRRLNHTRFISLMDAAAAAPTDCPQNLRLAPLAAAFADQVLITGHFDDAFLEVKNATPSQSPRSYDAEVLNGALDLNFENYDLRGAYAASLRVLGAAVRCGQEERRAWLEQAQLIAFSGEKRTVAEVTSSLEFSAEQIRSACVRLAARVSTPKHHESILESLLMLQDPLWILEYAESLAKSPKVASLSEESIAVFSERSRHSSLTDVGRLRSLLLHKEPAIVYAGALALSTYAPPVDELSDSIVDALARAQATPAWAEVTLLLVEVLTDAGIKLSTDQLSSLQVLKRMKIDDHSGHIQAFWYNQEQAKPVEFRRNKSGFISNAVAVEAARRRDGGAFLLYQHVSWATGASEWRSDRDEFGLAIWNGKGNEVEVISLPVAFAARRTGGAGGKRSIAGIEISESEVFLAVISPYSTSERWGDVSYLFSYHLENQSWRVWESGKDELEPRTLSKEGIAEDAIKKTTDAKIELGKDKGGVIGVQTDTTPYHLDDWERSVSSHQPLPGAPTSTLAEPKISITHPFRYQLGMAEDE